MTSFDLANVDQKSRNLHQKEFICGPTHPASWVILALLGAEIAGGHYMPPPGRVILGPSPVRMNPRAAGGDTKLPPLRCVKYLRNLMSDELRT